jgi:hypothetical protein
VWQRGGLKVKETREESDDAQLLRKLSASFDKIKIKKNAKEQNGPQILPAVSKMKPGVVKFFRFNLR